MVTVSERQRLELYERLGETLGKEHAEVLMDYLPPVGWSDVARRHDVDLLRAELRTEMAELRTEMAGLHGEMAGLHGEMVGLHGEMDGLRGEMDGLRSHLVAELSGLRSANQSGLDSLRVELHQQLSRQLVWLVGTILASVGAILGLIAYVN